MTKDARKMSMMIQYFHKAYKLISFSRCIIENMFLKEHISHNAIIIALSLLLCVTNVIIVFINTLFINA